jgi:hypothetical protein
MKTSEATRVLHDSFECDTTHRETVHVRELYRGRVLWEGEVDVFDLHGHPSAPRAYVLRFEGANGASRVYPVLHAGLVDSPQSAVRAMVVHEATAREG